MAIANVPLTDKQLIAPCGLNCRVCRAHLRAKKPCPGCRADDALKPKTRVICRIKTCERLVKGEVANCVDCDQFPCAALVRLEKRYTTKYGTSPIQNLMTIKKSGINRFLKAEETKWTCPDCGSLLCMHAARCPSCGYAWRERGTSPAGPSF